MTAWRANSPGVAQSVLDRLMGGSGGGGIGALNPNSVEAARLAVQRDLDALLNTRREERLVPSTFHESAKSLLNFGIPDFAVYNLKSPADQNRLRRAIEAAVREFEPRLGNVSVTLEGWDEARPVLRYRLEALLKLEPAPEQVAFETEIEADSGRFSVRTNADER